MNQLVSRPIALLALVAAALAPSIAQAHRSWLLPSVTVLSGNEPWVSVDAAVSGDVFHLENNALKLDGLSVRAPDGTKVTPENVGTGKFRSSFDLRLSQKGTYHLAVVSDELVASYKLNGENKRARGSAESLAKDIPPQAEALNVVRTQSRVETFVTSGKPSDAVMQPTRQGLELIPLTHPNDLFAGDESLFQFLVDGQPAADLTVSVVPGGVRYRNQLGEMILKTDRQGRFSVKWPAAGMYWLSASHGESPRPGMGADAAAAPAAPVGSLAAPLRRASYAVTLEVLPQ